MTYKFEPVFPLPKGFFPPFYDQMFDPNSKLESVYKNIGPNVDWDSIIHQKKSFSQSNRDTLVNVLQQQYQDLGNAIVHKNIESLGDPNTFTITTGQQIHVFLGPLYVVYKAISTILLAKDLSEKYTNYKFVPIFWMATEDHDKAEIDHVNLWGKPITWDTNQTGPVGRFNTHDLQKLVVEIKEATQNNAAFGEVISLFETAYGKYRNFADATRFLLNHFFGDYGMVVLDADNAALKAQFADSMRKDLFQGATMPAMQKSMKIMVDLSIDPSIPAKNGNFFWLENHKRERIDWIENGFKLQNSNIAISPEEMEFIIENEPEKLSPNVALRPLYQETILPNLAYIGGAGEIRYWMQLVEVFSAFDMAVPALIPRHSFVITDDKFEKWFDKSGLSISDLWLSEQELSLKFKKQMAEKNSMEEQLEGLKNLLDKINTSLYLQKSSQLKELKRQGEMLFKELNKSQNSYLEAVTSSPEMREKLDKMLKMKKFYFDINKPQERTLDFIEFLLKDLNIVKKLFLSPTSRLTNLYIVR